MRRSTSFCPKPLRRCARRRGASSANASTVCAACADNTTFNSVSGGLCVACPAGAYSAADRTLCLPCPANAYGVGCAGACPPHTHTLGNGTPSALGCLCLGGYACAYTKRLLVSVRLSDARNLTALIASLANATGVPVSSVTLLAQTPPNRRLLAAKRGAQPQLRERIERGHVHHDHGASLAWPDDEPRLLLEVHGAETAPHTLLWRHAHRVRVVHERAFG